jgi:glycerol-3-phosphate acyltransferase PlsY
MAGAVALPVAYVGMGLAFGWPVFGSQWPLLVFAVVMAGLILWKHRTNIARLRAGTENRFERRRSSAKPASGNGHGGDAGNAGHQAEERS